MIEPVIGRAIEPRPSLARLRALKDLKNSLRTRFNQPHGGLVDFFLTHMVTDLPILNLYDGR